MFKRDMIGLAIILLLTLAVLKLATQHQQDEKMIGYLAHNYSLLNMTCVNNCHR